MRLLQPPQEFLTSIGPEDKKNEDAASDQFITTHMSNVRRKLVFLVLVVGAIAIGAVILMTGPREKKFVINFNAMSPTLRPSDIVFARTFDPRSDELQRFDIVVFRSPPVVPSGIWVMRVIGLPGEAIDISTESLKVNGLKVAQDSMPAALRAKQWLPTRGPRDQQWLLGKDEVFIVGDNLSAANDSRVWGPLAISNVFGVVKEKARGKAKQLDLKPVVPVRFTRYIQDGPRTPVDLVATNQP